MAVDDAALLAALSHVLGQGFPSRQGPPAGMVLPAHPSPFGQALWDLLNRAPGADRGWRVGAGRRGSPNFPVGWFTPLTRNA